MHMKKGLYERYVPDMLLHEDEIGQLHRGHDKILKRDVLLYIFPRRSSYPECMMHGSSVLQILDRGETENEAFVVLEYIPGLLLGTAAKSRALSLKEALGMARQFVQILQEASQTKGRGLLFTKNNLWLTETGEVKVINSWAVSEEAVGREISDMFRLMHYMMFGEVKIELPLEQVIEEMSLSYPGDLFIIRKSLRAIWRREQKNRAEQYERMLAQTLEDITSLYHYIKKTQAGLRPFSVQEEGKNTTSHGLLSAPLKTRAHVEAKKRKIPGLSPKRLAAVALVAIVCVVAFAFAQNDKPSSAKSVETISQETGGQQSEENKAGVEVPDVEGLSLQEASQKLSESGLRYKYYLESSFFKKGTVLKQNPKPGEKIPRVEVVELWVSE